MATAPVTRPSLLFRLRNRADQEAWQQFVEIYAPLVFAYAQRRGLQEADAADLTQEVLCAVTAAQGIDYDPRRGLFRSWLFAVTRRKLQDFWSRRRRQCPGTGDTDVQSLLEDQPDEHDDQQQWDEEYQEHLFHAACEHVRPEFEETSWQAFWQTAVENNPAKVVARNLEMTVGAVYIAKSRIIARLREQIRQLQLEEAVPG